MTIMNTAVSGMLGQNNWLSTIAQNVANSSTTGYKDAETQFASLVDSSLPSSTYAGLGVTTTSMTMASEQGSITGTATPTDLAVQGAGFFVVNDSNGNTALTRDGSFVPDASGNLVNAAGYYLMGLNVQNGLPPAGSISSPSQLQKVNVEQSAPLVVPTTTGTLSVNLPSTSSVVPAASTPAGGGSTTTDKTSIVAYDNSGNAVTLDVYATRVADSSPGTPTWEVDVYNAANAASGGGFPYSAPALASQTINFDPTTGSVASGGSLSIAIPNGQTMSLNMGGSSQLATSFIVNSAQTNGNAPTTLTGVSIDSAGILSYNYANGISLPAYSIPLGNVASPDSLTAQNGTVFTLNGNTGPLELGEPGTRGLGTVESSALENSTVNVADELTSMIQAQSDYGFNSQVFQTGSSIIDDLNKL